MEVTYTQVFKNQVRKLNRRYRSLPKDFAPLTDELKSGVLVGDRISGFDNDVYKARVKNSDNAKGKSGGYRVIYYVRTQSEVRFLAIYSKSDRGTISNDSILKALTEE